MKSIITLILSVCLCFVTFVACTSSVEAPAPDATIENVNKPSPDPAPAFKEIEIVKNEQFALYLTSNPYDDGFWGYEIKVRVENYTDKNLTFAMDDTSVNGYMVNAIFVETVAAGKKANTDVSFFYSELEDNGITSFDNFEFSLRVYDADDWMADHLMEDEFFSISFK